jgi:hypothetical protein
LLLVFTISTYVPSRGSANAAAASQDIVIPKPITETLDVEPLKTVLPISALQNIVIGYLDGYSKKDFSFADLEKSKEQIACISPDGRYIVCRSKKQIDMHDYAKSHDSLKIFKRDTTQFKLIQDIPLEISAMDSIYAVFSPCSQYLALIHKKKIKIYELQNEQFVKKQTISYKDDCALSNLGFFEQSNTLFFGILITIYGQHKQIGCIWKLINQKFEKFNYFSSKEAIQSKICSNGHIVCVYENQIPHKKVKAVSFVVYKINDKNEYIQAAMHEFTIENSVEPHCLSISDDGKYFGYTHITQTTALNFLLAPSTSIEYQPPLMEQTIWYLENNEFKHLSQAKLNLVSASAIVNACIIPSTNKPYLYVETNQEINIFKISDQKYEHINKITYPFLTRTIFHPINSQECILSKWVSTPSLSTEIEYKFELWENSKEVLAQEIKKTQVLKK